MATWVTARAYLTIAPISNQILVVPLVMWGEFMRHRSCRDYSQVIIYG